MTSFDVEVTCPGCGRSYTVPRLYVGKVGRCRVCGAAVKVPAEAGAGGEAAGSIADPAAPHYVCTGTEEKLPAV